jgi:hypothetical protein
MLPLLTPTEIARYHEALYAITGNHCDEWMARTYRRADARGTATSEETTP